MKGIVLAGGKGTRLSPMTKVTNKHLLPVYDRPMIYFPIQTLAMSGIKEIMIVTGTESAGDFVDLLGDGYEFGVNLTYRIQARAGGIAEALGLCEDFADDDDVVVILGDNIFLDDSVSGAIESYNYDTNAKGNAVIFLKEVEHPNRFGVATIDPQSKKITKIVEKPVKPESNHAVTGLYVYTNKVWDIIRSIKPSDRGEMEITDVNNAYINANKLKYMVVDGFWSDAGTVESLFISGEHVRNMK